MNISSSKQVFKEKILELVSKMADPDKDLSIQLLSLDSSILELADSQENFNKKSLKERAEIVAKVC